MRYIFILFICILIVFYIKNKSTNEGFISADKTFTSQELRYEQPYNSTIDRIAKMSMYIPNYVRKFCVNSEELMKSSSNPDPMKTDGFCKHVNQINKTYINTDVSTDAMYSNRIISNSATNFDCREDCLKDISCKGYTVDKDGGNCVKYSINSLDVPLPYANSSNIGGIEFYEKMNNINQSRFNDSFLRSVKKGEIEVEEKDFRLDDSNMYVEYNNDDDTISTNIDSKYMEFSNSVLNYAPMKNPINQKGQSFHSNYKNDCINTCENTNGCTGINFWDPDTIFYPEVEIEKATLGQNCLVPVPSYQRKEDIKALFSSQCNQEDNRQVCQLKPDWYNRDKTITNCNDKDIKINYNCLRQDSSGRDIVTVENRDIILHKKGNDITYSHVLYDENKKQILKPVPGLDCRRTLDERIDIRGVSYAHNLSNFIKTDKLQKLCNDKKYGNKEGCGPYTFEQIITPNDDPAPLCNDKKLEVEYTCGDEYKKEIFTKETGFKIECPVSSDGKNRLKIESAVYGRECETDLENLKVIDTITQISRDSKNNIEKFLKTDSCKDTIGKNSKTECTYKASDKDLQYFRDNKDAILNCRDNGTPSDRYGSLEIIEAKYGANCENIPGYNASNNNDILNIQSLCGDNTKIQCNVDKYMPIKDPLVQSFHLFYIQYNNDMYLTADLTQTPPRVILKEYTGVDQAWEKIKMPLTGLSAGTSEPVLFYLKLDKQDLYLKLDFKPVDKVIEFCDDGDTRMVSSLLSVIANKQVTPDYCHRPAITRSRSTVNLPVAKPVKPSCKSNRNLKGLMCYLKKGIDGGIAADYNCDDGLIKKASLCYKPCPDGYESQGVYCSEKCDSSQDFKSSGPLTCLRGAKTYALKTRTETTYVPVYDYIKLEPSAGDIWRIDNTDGNMYNVTHNRYASVKDYYTVNLTETSSVFWTIRNIAQKDLHIKYKCSKDGDIREYNVADAKGKTLNFGCQQLPLTTGYYLIAVINDDIQSSSSSSITDSNTGSVNTGSVNTDSNTGSVNTGEGSIIRQIKKKLKTIKSNVVEQFYGGGRGRGTGTGTGRGIAGGRGRGGNKVNAGNAAGMSIDEIRAFGKIIGGGRGVENGSAANVDNSANGGAANVDNSANGQNSTGMDIDTIRAFGRSIGGGRYVEGDTALVNKYNTDMQKKYEDEKRKKLENRTKYLSFNKDKCKQITSTGCEDCLTLLNGKVSPPFYQVWHITKNDDTSNNYKISIINTGGSNNCSSVDNICMNNYLSITNNKLLMAEKNEDSNFIIKPILNTPYYTIQGLNTHNDGKPNSYINIENIDNSFMSFMLTMNESINGQSLKKALFDFKPINMITDTKKNLFIQYKCPENDYIFSESVDVDPGMDSYANINIKCPIQGDNVNIRSVVWDEDTCLNTDATDAIKDAVSNQCYDYKSGKKPVPIDFGHNTACSLGQYNTNPRSRDKSSVVLKNPNNVSLSGCNRKLDINYKTYADPRNINKVVSENIEVYEDIDMPPIKIESIKNNKLLKRNKSKSYHDNDRNMNMSNNVNLPENNLKNNKNTLNNLSHLKRNQNGELLFDTTFKYKTVEVPDGNCELMNNRFANPIYASPGEIILKTGNKIIDSENNVYEENGLHKDIPDPRLDKAYRYKGPSSISEPDKKKNVMVSKRYYYEKIMKKKMIQRKGYTLINNDDKIIPTIGITSVRKLDIQVFIKNAINKLAYIEDNCTCFNIIHNNDGTLSSYYFKNVDIQQANSDDIVQSTNPDDYIVYIVEELTPY